MSRKEKMVTRTFTTTTFVIVGIKDNAIYETQPETVIGEMSEKECKAYAEKVYGDVFMVAGVKDVTYSSKLYGMYEADFLRNSVELPPRTKED